MIAADQVTKQMVVRSVGRDESVTVIRGVLYISHFRNSGAAFGTFRGFPGLLAMIALVGVGVLAVVLARRPSPLVGAGAALVAGGATGNLIDRAFRPWPFHGTVVDFIEFRGRWPAFNVADSAITIGVLILLFASLRREQVGS